MVVITIEDLRISGKKLKDENFWQIMGMDWKILEEKEV